MNYIRVIFDWKRTLYDPETKELIPGAIEILKYIRSQGVPRFLIGKGGEEMYAEVERLGLKKYFLKVKFVGSEKSPEDFREFTSPEPEKVLLIGDRLSSEIEVGNILGAFTLQVKQGKFADELPENDMQKPKHVVASLQEAVDFLR